MQYKANRFYRRLFFHAKIKISLFVEFNDANFCLDAAEQVVNIFITFLFLFYMLHNLVFPLGLFGHFLDLDL